MRSVARSPGAADEPRPDLPPASILSARRSFVIATILLIVAAAWRVALAVQLPVISRDGVVFCWYAQALGEEGASYLRSPDAQQHPLYPALILAVQRTAQRCGAADAPLTWQISGQLLAIIAGLVVVLLAGSIAARLVVLLEIPIDARVTRLVAMFIAAALDHNVWLSVDVMSDQIHAAFYLGAVRLALPSWQAWRLAAAGALAGLAFLTRQEGFVPVLATVIALLIASRSLGPRLTAFGLVSLLVGFLLLGGPYWSAVGRFSTKKDPARWMSDEAADSRPAAPRGDHIPDAGHVPQTSLAKLETTDVTLIGALPEVIYRLFRAGRVVVPLLALLPILNLRGRWLDPRLVGVLACIGGHLMLTALLLDRYGYLAVRHMVVVVLLLIPFAAMLIARLVEIAVVRRSRLMLAAIAVVVATPLLAYAFRLPNGNERYLRDAAAWLTAQTEAMPLVVSGSSGRRIAFYAAAKWRPWNETPEDVAGVLGMLHEAGAGVFALETGPGFERVGNDALLAALCAPGHSTVVIDEVRRFEADRGVALHLLRFRRAN